MKNNKPIGTITVGPRETNMELLRIVAMFMVLALHVNIFSLGWPDKMDMAQNPASGWTRVLLGCGAAVCVDVFVLVSGWFTIKSSVMGLSKFLFQCLFFITGTGLAAGLSGYSEIDKLWLTNLFWMNELQWFIISYLVLYLLSPILNSFLIGASLRAQRWFLALYFFVQTLYGFLIDQTWGWWGSSPMVFIGLYCLGFYLRHNLKEARRYGLWIYAVSVLANCIVAFAFGVNDFGINYLDPLSNANPLVVLGAAGLVMWFSELKTGYKRFVNWISASAFAVYLLHTQPDVMYGLFKPISCAIFHNHNGIAVIGLDLLFMVGVFGISVLVDQLRILCWKQVSKLNFDKIVNNFDK